MTSIGFLMEAHRKPIHKEKLRFWDVYRIGVGNKGRRRGQSSRLEGKIESGPQMSKKQALCGKRTLNVTLREQENRLETAGAHKEALL